MHPADVATAAAEPAPWESVKFEAFTAMVAAELEVERASLHDAEAELAELEQRFAEEEAFIEFFASGEAKDIVELDVSGERMAVKRSTLMLCKDSALARQVRARSRCRPTRSLFS